jgi:ankyrin repeat protein
VLGALGLGLAGLMNSARQNEVLRQAAADGRVKTMQAALRAGADADSPDAIGWTPLAWAAVSGNLAAVRTLTDHGAVLDAPTGEGDYYTVRGRARREVVSEVVRARLRIRDVNSYCGGVTPLMIAVDAGHAEMARYLVLQGASIRQVDKAETSTLKRVNGRPHLRLLVTGPGVALSDPAAASARSVRITPIERP